MTDLNLVETELLKKLASGDPSVLGDLFAIHRTRLLRMVNFRLDTRLQARVDADDILQESYVQATQRIENFRAGDRSFYVWLRLIVVQTMIDLHRHHVGTQKRDVRREQPKRPAYPEATSVSLIRCLAGSMLTPSQIVVKEESLSQLERAFDEMSPVDQEVLALRHFEELTNAEISELLGIEQKAASIRYVRAVARLKNILSDLPGFFDTVEGDS